MSVLLLLLLVISEETLLDCIVLFGFVNTLWEGVHSNETLWEGVHPNEFEWVMEDEVLLELDGKCTLAAILVCKKVDH